MSVFRDAENVVVKDIVGVLDAHSDAIKQKYADLHQALEDHPKWPGSFGILSGVNLPEKVQCKPDSSH